MQNHTKLWVKSVALAGLLWTMGVSNVIADDVENAAAGVFQKLKLAQQPAIPAPAPQPAPMGTTPPAPPAPDEQDADPPSTVTLEADGSGIPPDSLEALTADGETDSSADTGDGSTDPAE